MRCLWAALRSCQVGNRIVGRAQPNREVASSPFLRLGYVGWDWVSQSADPTWPSDPCLLQGVSSGWWY